MTAEGCFAGIAHRNAIEWDYHSRSHSNLLMVSADFGPWVHDRQDLESCRDVRCAPDRRGVDPDGDLDHRVHGDRPDQGADVISRTR